MEGYNAKYQSLLSWIDLSSWDQASWIFDYLVKREAKSLAGEYTPLTGTREQLVEGLRNHLYVAGNRELIRAMRGAWHQKKYRERSGRQVSFQLPERVVAELDEIAKDRNKSRTQALQQVIHDAAKRNQRERARRYREGVKEIKRSLKTLNEL